MKNKIIGIAINDYQDTKIKNLNNCLNDLNAVIDILTTKYEFHQIELFAEKEQTTHSFLYNRLYDIFINALEDENVLILFAGHGEYNEILGASYWLTHDSTQNDASTWFNVSNLLDFMRISKAKHICLISDSCFSGAIFEESSRGGGISALENKKSRYALTSGSIERVSDGEIDKLSPFTQALIQTLNSNSGEEFSFTSLAENTIINFTPHKKQTPLRGELITAGHEGGTFIFRLKNENEPNDPYQNMSLPLDISSSINIDYNFIIPFFHKNSNFNNGFINAYIQHLAYSIISEARMFLLENEKSFIQQTKERSFSLHVGYTIHTLNEKYLSISISRQDYYGGPRPNSYIYTVNFAFNPDIQFDFYDLVDYSSFGSLENFLEENIKKYYPYESKDYLKKHINLINPRNIDFSFNNDTLTLYLLKAAPTAYIVSGILNIPLKEIKLKYPLQTVN